MGLGGTGLLMPVRSRLDPSDQTRTSSVAVMGLAPAGVALAVAVAIDDHG